MSRISRAWLQILLPLALIAGACGTDAESVQTVAPTPADTQTSATTAPAEPTENFGVDRTLRIGYPSSPSIANQTAWITNERLNAQGWDIENIYFARTELPPQALAQGDIQMMVMLYLEPLRSIQAGGDNTTVQFVMENSSAEFIVIAKNEYATCEEMDGVRFGIHGETSATSVAALRWLETCGAEPEILVIPGGDNRIIALENGELDATLVQLADWVALDSFADEGEYIIVDSGDAMAFTGAGYFINTVWLDENRDVAVAYIAELLRTFRLIHDDPTILEEAVKVNVEVPEKTIAQTVELYLDSTLVNLAPMEPPGGTVDALEATIAAFTPDELDEGLSVSGFYDPALLAEAMAYLESNP